VTPAHSIGVPVVPLIPKEVGDVVQNKEESDDFVYEDGQFLQHSDLIAQSAAG
jgi:hypothetical protein